MLTLEPGTKNPAQGGVCVESLVVLLAVAFLETVYATAGIQHLVLSGVKRVRSAGNFNLDEWVLVSIFPLDGFLTIDR